MNYFLAALISLLLIGDVFASNYQMLNEDAVAFAPLPHLEKKWLRREPSIRFVKRGETQAYDVPQSWADFLARL